MARNRELGGRPTKYNEKMNEQVYKLCLLGATDKQIADFFDVHVDTINNWKKSEPQFLESLKRGKQVADMNVANALYNKALGYNYEEETATKMGVVRLEKVAHADTTAAIFWLKNRQPKQWRDKQEITTEQTIKHSDSYIKAMNGQLPDIWDDEDDGE